MLDPLSFVVWNIRGASRADSLRYLGKICFGNSIHLVALLEPMSNIAQMEVVRRRLKFDNASAFLEGKIWIFWPSELRLNCVEHAEQFVQVTASFRSGVSLSL